MLAARDLFHRQGIRAVGVEAIAAAAGTNKMTLYRHFGSKDELICECLRGVAAEIDAVWDGIEAASPADARVRLSLWVRRGIEFVADDGRGCDLINAAVEIAQVDHPARRFVQGVKARYRERLGVLCAAAGAARPEILADALFLLLEGARVNRQSAGGEGPGARFILVADAAIAALGGWDHPALSGG